MKLYTVHEFSENADSLLSCYRFFYEQKEYGYAVYSLNFAAYCLVLDEKIIEAKELVELASEIVEGVDYENNELMTNQYYIYALIYFELGNPQLSIHYAEKFIDLYSTFGQCTFAKHVIYQNLGVCNSIIGDYDRSIKNFNESIRLSPASLHSDRIRLQTLISEAYLKLGDLTNAKLYLDLANENLGNSDNPDDSIYLYEESAAYYLIINKLDSAQYYIDKAYRLGPGFRKQINLLQHQGELNLLKNNSEATINYEDAIRISTDSLKFNKFKISQVYLNAAKSYMENEQNEEAINYLNKSISSVWPDFTEENDISKVLNHRLVSEALILKSLLLAKENKQIESKKAFEISLSVINFLLKSKITSWESALNFSSILKSYYSELIKEAIHMKDFDFAFSITQSIHAILLSLKLDDVKAIKHFGLNEEHTEQINTLKIDISKQNTVILNMDSNAPLKDSLEAILFYKQRRLDSLINTLENSNPAYYKLKYAQTKKLTPKQIQNNILSNNSSLIEYFMGEKNLYTFIISHNENHILTTPVDSNFISEINNLNSSIRSINGDFDQFTSSSTYLYNKLLKDAIIKLGPSINTLYIIPDNEINYVPFEVLINSIPDEADNDRYDLLPYVINNYSISYHYSSALLDSDHTSLSDNVTGFAPSFTSTFSKKENLDSLLYNKKEVMIINGITDGQINIDTAANLNKLKEAVNNYKIAHLATHAMCNDTFPFESKIYLEDGPLHAYEIYNMPHALNLAVLSACDTGTGVLKKGEGLMSLARAFISSGCTAGIPSLWTVNDKNSVQIMEKFYKHLYDGQTVRESLTKAKRDYLKSVDSVREAHPYHWATFIMIGNADMAISTFPWILIFIILVLILALFYLVKKFLNV